MDDLREFRPEGAFSISLRLESQIENLRVVRWATLSVCQLLALSEEATSALEVCAVEAVTNIIRHGYSGESGRRLEFEIAASDEQVALRFTDEGRRIPAEKWSEAETADEIGGLDDLTVGGRGLFLMRRLMTSVEYRPGPPRNVLILEKCL